MAQKKKKPATVNHQAEIRQPDADSPPANRHPAGYMQEDDHWLGLKQPVLRSRIQAFDQTLVQAAEMAESLGIGPQVFLHECRETVRAKVRRGLAWAAAERYWAAFEAKHATPSAATIIREEE